MIGSYAREMSSINNDTMDKLRVYKQVCLKIRSTLVSGREDLVSPTLVTRNFVEGFASSLNDRLLSEQAMNRTDQTVYNATSSFGNGASANSADEDCGGPTCPFIMPVDGWSVEYSEVICSVSETNMLKCIIIDLCMFFLQYLSHMMENVVYY